MGKAPAKYLPCPYCNAVGKGTFKLVPKPGIENPNPENLSDWQQICTNCGKEVDLDRAWDKFKVSGGKYKPIRRQIW
jgi:hypothetical protein